MDVMKMALESGAPAIQLRERGLTDLELYRLAEKAQALCGEFGAHLLINDRVDVALAVGAAGAHLGVHSFSAREARKLLGSDRIIGVSTHSLQEAKRAEAEGADFVVFGPVYHTPSKARYGEPLGEGRLREAVQSVNIPVLAIGGVKASSMPEVLATGAMGAAVISAIFSASNPAEETRRMLALLSRH